MTTPLHDNIIHDNIRSIMKRSGLHLADIAVATKRSVPYVSLQLAGKRPLTLELCNAVLELAKQKDERVQLLKEGSSLLFDVMQSRMAAGEIEEAQRVAAIATLLEDLAAEIGKTPEPNVSLDVPEGWGDDIAAVVTDADGKPIFGLPRACEADPTGNVEMEIALPEDNE